MTKKQKIVSISRLRFRYFFRFIPLTPLGARQPERFQRSDGVLLLLLLLRWHLVLGVPWPTIVAEQLLQAVPVPVQVHSGRPAYGPHATVRPRHRHRRHRAPHLTKKKKNEVISFNK